MKLTLEIEDSRYSTFLDFIKTLSYVSVSTEETVAAWQKKEVEKRMDELSKYPEKAVDFELIVKEARKKYGI